MHTSWRNVLPWWTLLLPALALAVLGLSAVGWAGTVWQVLVGASLVAAVLAAVHHAEVVAHRVGEPYGTLLLAVAVTLIPILCIMIVCNGVVGVCVLVGGLRHRVMLFRVEGTSPALAVLVALATLILVLPTYTTSTAGPTFSPAQLGFAGVVSLLLYGAFVFVQTVRHRDYFLPVTGGDDPHSHARPPGNAVAVVSGVLLMACLVAVVGLAKVLAPAIEQGVRSAGAPQAVVGVIVALLVLLPETVAAVRAAALNRLQTSLNLALGSALASIGLTIPVVAVLSLWLGMPLVLGLGPKDVVLLVLTIAVATLTLGSGRATVLQGAVHLVLFAVFLFLAVVP